MEESLGGTFKLIGSKYSIGKSKMKDMLLCKDLWLPVQFGKSKPNKIDALTWEVMHLKAVAYIRFFIDMILYNNFNKETKVDVIWKKIGFMFENKNTVNKVSVF